MKSEKQIKEYLNILEARLRSLIVRKESADPKTAEYHQLLNEVVETQKQLEILRWVLR